MENNNTDITFENDVYSELLLQLMEVNKVYKITVETETGLKTYCVIRDEEDSLDIYDEHQIGSA